KQVIDVVLIVTCLSALYDDNQAGWRRCRDSTLIPRKPLTTRDAPATPSDVHAWRRRASCLARCTRGDKGVRKKAEFCSNTYCHRDLRRALGGPPRSLLLIFCSLLQPEKKAPKTIRPAAAAFFLPCLFARTAKGNIGREKKDSESPSERDIRFPSSQARENSPPTPHSCIPCFPYAIASPHLASTVRIVIRAEVYTQQMVLDSYTGKKDGERKRWTPGMSLAIVDKKPQQQWRPGGFVAIFFRLLDWNRRLAKKKLSSRKPLPPGILSASALLSVWFGGSLIRSGTSQFEPRKGRRKGSAPMIRCHWRSCFW
ncbi:hypothetical protein GW17_00044334, partial [Ensete ventricosum]